MSNPLVSRGIYIALFVLNLAIGAFLLQLGAGKVPIPAAAEWAVPILLAVLNGISLFLPRIGTEAIAQQVDHLRASNVPSEHMVVMDAGTKREAAAVTRHAEAALAGKAPEPVDHELPKAHG